LRCRFVYAGVENERLWVCIEFYFGEELQSPAKAARLIQTDRSAPANFCVIPRERIEKLAKIPELWLHCVVSEPFSENCYLVGLPGRQECVIVDPGSAVEDMVQIMREHDRVPEAILLTHGHADHIAGNADLRDIWPKLPIWIGKGDADMLTDAVANLSEPFGMPITSPPADHLLTHQQLIRVAGLDLEVRDAPGHSPGHIVYVYRGCSPWVVFGGDVLFSGSVGRTDFPGGSFDVLSMSIERQLFTLSDDTFVFSGHGRPTTIGREKQTNPFVGRS
jgi:hydroxyacylglutathione hydrolase